MSAKQLILHVEDDPNDVLLIKRALSKVQGDAGIRTISDGESAIEYLSGGCAYANRADFPLPSLLLLDLKLPRRTGLEVLEWLRAQPAPLKRLPVVVLTSSSQSVDVQRAYELGANAYVVKPTEFAELANAVKLLYQHWFVHSEKPDVESECSTHDPVSGR